MPKATQKSTSKSKNEPQKKSKKKSKKPRKPKLFRPTLTNKIAILQKFKTWNLHLWGKFPSGITFADREKKWDEIVAFVKELTPVPENFGKETLLRAFRTWKKNFTDLISESKETGKAPGKPWKDDNKLMYDIVGENVAHQSMLKVKF